jgi:hypothetical protein
VSTTSVENKVHAGKKRVGFAPQPVKTEFSKNTTALAGKEKPPQLMVFSPEKNRSFTLWVLVIFDSFWHLMLHQILRGIAL